MQTMLTDTSLVAGLRPSIYSCIEANPRLNVYVLLDLNHPVSENHVLHHKALSQRELVCDVQPVLRQDLAHDLEICPILLNLRPANSNGYPDEVLADLLEEYAIERASSINGAYVAAWILS